ncbi:MAG: hypothetical protein WEB00_12980 [Dehalococcoidia bacterium]
MKQKVSMTIERELLDKVACRGPNDASRSRSVELALMDWLARVKGEELDRQEREIINRNSAQLAIELADVLEDQSIRKDSAER